MERNLGVLTATTKSVSRICKQTMTTFFELGHSVQVSGFCRAFCCRGVLWFAIFVAFGLGSWFGFKNLRAFRLFKVCSFALGCCALFRFLLGCRMCHLYGVARLVVVFCWLVFSRFLLKTAWLQLFSLRNGLIPRRSSQIPRLDVFFGVYTSSRHVTLGFATFCTQHLRLGLAARHLLGFRISHVL